MKSYLGQQRQGNHTSTDHLNILPNPDLYTVSRCRTRGESEDHTGKKARKKGSIHLALKPGADVTRSPKQGYQ